MHREEPLGQRRARFVEDRSGPGGCLRPARTALEQLPRLTKGVLAYTALPAEEAVRPAHSDQRRATLLFRAVEPLELDCAQTLLELHLVARHRRLPDLAARKS